MHTVVKLLQYAQYFFFQCYGSGIWFFWSSGFVSGFWYFEISKSTTRISGRLLSRWQVSLFCIFYHWFSPSQVRIKIATIHLISRLLSFLMSYPDLLLKYPFLLYKSTKLIFLSTENGKLGNIRIYGWYSSVLCSVYVAKLYQNTSYQNIYILGYTA